MPQQKRSRVREMAHTALFTALLVICTWIAVPTQPPFTMQTFAVFTAALTLGRRGAAAAAVYLALGALGVPVFAGFSGGIGHLASITGGYAVGFLPAALIAGWAAEKSRRTGIRALGCAAGLAVCYAVGTLWYAFVYAGGTAGIGTALMTCVVPFLIPDAAKIALALLVSRRILKK